MTFTILVHGGAGVHSRSDDVAVKRGLKRACLQALAVLERPSGRAIDAVEAAIRALEDDQSFNAGFGSNLTEDGNVECDASIMDGSNAAFGAVGAVSGIKNPISAARVVLERGKQRGPLNRVPPLLVSGVGAQSYCRGDSIEMVEPHTMISVRAREERSKWLQYYDSAKNEQSTMMQTDDRMRGLEDTVGAVILDADGNVTAGVSSGGLLLKYSGRIGEAAIYGAGCWADSGTPSQTRVGCSVSGTGEQIMQSIFARTLAQRVQEHDPVEAVPSFFKEFQDQCVSRDGPNVPANAGAIILTSEDNDEGSSRARAYAAFTTESMAIGWLSSEDRRAKARVYRQADEREVGAAEPGRSVFLTSLPL